VGGGDVGEGSVLDRLVLRCQPALVLTLVLLPAGHLELLDLAVRVLPDHAWQNDSPGASDRHFQMEDCCGFLIDTPDGTIWAPGDSRLIPEHHLHMATPDAMLFDFSDSDWHVGLDGAVQMANAYPRTPLLLQHWGCVHAPHFPPFNADPASLPDRVVNPDRIVVLAPGEPYTLSPLNG
jgi:L-ascorbate metabolism protein UlaG (beta-lactamase superfamily)